MATGLPGSTARKNSSQQTGYLRFRIAFNDPGIASGLPKQWLPQGAVILRSTVTIVTAFNAGASAITVGTVGPVWNNIVAAANVAPGATGQTTNIQPTGAALGPLAADTQVFATYTQSGAPATAGAAIVTIEYACDNDM